MAGYIYTGSSGGSWGTNANWSPNTGHPDASGDVALVDNSVDLGGNTYTVGGLVLTNGASLGNGSLTLDNGGSAATVLYDGTGSSAIATVSTSLTLNSDLHAYSNAGGSGHLVFDGKISGSGGVDVAQGDVFFNNSANDYTGATIVQASTLAGASTEGFGTSTVILSGGTLEEGIGDTSATLSNVLTFESSTARVVSHTGSTTTLSGAIQFLFSNDTAIFGGGSDGNGNLVITNVIMGDIFPGDAVEFAGTGNTTLTAANTYDGTTTIDGGATLEIENSTALGTADVGTSVADGGTLAINGAFNVSGEALTLNGNGVGGRGALDNVSGNTTWSGAITLDSASTIASDASQLTLSGGITGTNTNLSVTGAGATLIDSAITTGTGTVTMDGSGTLALTGANTFTGATNVNAGVLEVNGGSALSDSARVTIASGADLAVLGSETVGSVAGSGKLSIFTGSTFTVGNDGTSSTFSGFVGSNGSPVTLDKVGAGTFTLTGDSSGGFAGTIKVDAGTLQIGDGTTNGSLSSAAAIHDNAALVYDLTNGRAATIGNTISGTGTLTVETPAGGLGVALTLMADNSYAGTTTIGSNVDLFVGMAARPARSAQAT